MKLTGNTILVTGGSSGIPTSAFYSFRMAERTIASAIHSHGVPYGRGEIDCSMGSICRTPMPAFT
jgi:hypothetical protein